MSATDEKMHKLIFSFVENLNQVMSPASQEDEDMEIIRIDTGCEIQTKFVTKAYREITLCDPEKIKQRMEVLEAESVWKKTFENLAKPKKMQRLTSVEAHDKLQNDLTLLAYDHPNFSEPTLRIALIVRLCAIRKTHIQFKPMLMYGPPGTGKTRWVRKLCALLGMHRIAIDLSGGGDFIKITGSSRSWKNAGPGDVAHGLAKTECANPIIVFDEIDKTHANHQGNPLDRLLMLTEKETAIEFSDDYIEVPINTSHCSIIAMANTLEPLPAPFLSRFECYEIRHLDESGRKNMMQNVYTELLQEEGITGLLKDTLDKEVIELLVKSKQEGRELKSTIQKAIFNACEDLPMIEPEEEQAVAVQKQHLHLNTRSVKNSIGFIR